MIKINKFPEGMTVDEANEYLKMFCAMHPFEKEGEINIKLDGEFVDVYLNVEEKVPFQRIRRITGYLVGTVDRWNNAKTAELHDRVKHITGEDNDDVRV